MLLQTVTTFKDQIGKYSTIDVLRTMIGRPVENILKCLDLLLWCIGLLWHVHVHAPMHCFVLFYRNAGGYRHIPGPSPAQDIRSPPLNQANNPWSPPAFNQPNFGAPQHQVNWFVDKDYLCIDVSHAKWSNYAYNRARWDK